MISVCMTTYNGEKYVKEQIDSILSQLGSNDELIISDDNSIDDTCKIISSYNDKRIKLLKHNRTFIKKNHASGYYCSSNFFNAIKNAQGDYIFLSDQDDVWYPEKIKIMLKELENNDLVLSNFSIINKDKNIVNEKYFSKSPIKKSWFMNMNTNPFFGCCMAIRKDNLKLVIPPDDIRVVSYDTWIGTILSYMNKKILFIDQPLIYYRRHGNNVSFATGKSKNSIFFKIYWRLEFLFQMSKFLHGGNV